jgi:tripartite-type tricarboxylate transporter receptor subunit TctC
MTTWVKLLAAVLAFAQLLVAPNAVAQAYPSKPIRLVVPTSVGTPVDIVSRIVAGRMSTALGQPIAVDNRPGATGIVGAEEVLKNPADGYTLLTIMMPMSVGQTIYPHLAYDLRKDFEPVGQTAFSYNVLVVHPSVAAISVGELVALLKARPGRLNFSSGGPGTPAHVAGELLKQQTGTDALHVPYNQFPQAIGDLLSGQNQFMFAATAPVMSHIASGKLRALAVTGAQRIGALSSVPTMIEAGYPGFVVRDWQGVVVKTGTPREVIARVNAAIVAALADSEIKQMFLKLGADTAAGSPARFARLIGAEVERWAKVAKAANMRVD